MDNIDGSGCGPRREINFFTFHEGRSHELPPINEGTTKSPRPDSVQRLLGNEADWLDRLVKRLTRKIHQENPDDLEK